MKLFKNKVGRPSNNVKKNRKIFILLLIVGFILFIFLGVRLISSRIVKIKGAAGELTLNCPTYVSVGSQFICSSNMSGATFNASKENLSKGYKNKIVHKRIKLKYSKVGSYVVSVSKQGYSTVSKKVKVITGKDGLKLACPKTVYVGQKFICKTNSTKSTIRLSKKGLSSHYLKILKANDGVLKTSKGILYLMYTREGYAKVVAEQTGFKPVTKYVKIISKTSSNVKVKYSDAIVENFAAFIGAEAGANPEGFEAQLVTGAVFLNNMYFSCGRKPFVTSPQEINKSTMCKTFSYQSLYSPNYCNYTFDTVGYSKSQRKQLTVVAKLVLSGIFTIPKEINCEGKLSNWRSNGEQIAMKWGHLATKNKCKMDDTYEDGCSQVYAYSKYCVSGKLSNKDVNGRTVSTNFNAYKKVSDALYKQYVIGGKKIW